MTAPTPDSAPKSNPAPDPFPGTVDGAVLGHLRATKTPLTAAAIAEATALPLTTVQRALGKLAREKLVRRAGGGVFALAAHPGHRQGRRA